MDNSIHTAAARVGDPADETDDPAGSDVVVLVFVNQTTVISNDAPTDSTSVVQVTLDKIGSRWLISAFEPK